MSPINHCYISPHPHKELPPFYIFPWKQSRDGRAPNVRIAALSTMFRMVNLLIALSLGVHLEQLEQRMGFTWPRPFLLRPLRGAS